MQIDLFAYSSFICLRDFLGHKNRIHDNLDHIKASMEWLVCAQNKDGGISAGYSLNPKQGYGWQASYPEITGYIIPTFFDYYHFTTCNVYREKALKMCDWLLEIQMETGGFQGNTINHPQKEMVFDTGQILRGLIRAYKETNNSKYLISAKKAADFLVKKQDKDGSWKKYSLNNIPHTYHTRVAWQLAIFSEIINDDLYLNSAIKNIEWAINNQQENGWFNNSAMAPNTNPLLHTIAYTIRGILETGIIQNDEKYNNSAQKTANQLLALFNKNGFLAGAYDSEWNSKGKWSCLAGNAQTSIIWLKLNKITKEKKYLDGAIRMNNALKSSQFIKTRKKEIRGAIKGSQPFYGKYLPLTFPSWAVKFFIDALLIETQINTF